MSHLNKLCLQLVTRTSLSYTSRNNSFTFTMKVALSTQDSSLKFKFDMFINMSLRSYCIRSLILSIPVAEDYHTY